MSNAPDSSSTHDDARGHETGDPAGVERSGALPQLSRKGWAWSIAGIAALVGAVATYAFAAAQAESVRWREVGFDVVDDSQVEATFDVFLYSDADAECLVRALNESYTEVGVVTVEVARSAGPEQRIETVISTTERATTATVAGCTALGD